MSKLFINTLIFVNMSICRKLWPTEQLKMLKKVEFAAPNSTRDREQLIVLPLIAILLPLIVMGGRVVSGIAIVMGGEASYNTMAINCSQYLFFI